MGARSRAGVLLSDRGADLGPFPRPEHDGGDGHGSAGAYDPRGDGAGVTVVCVYRTGGDYTIDYVHALKRGLSRTLRNYRFLCLTDDPNVYHLWRVPLQHNWTGWWSKIEVLNPGLLTGPVLYLDLDTLPVGNLGDIAGYRGEFAMIRDLNPRNQSYQSGVMAFRAGPGTQAADLYQRFTERAAEWMRRYRGDGEWLNDHAESPDALQDRYPSQIVSLKWGAKQGPPKGSRLVLAHGRPRLHDPAAGWAHRQWALHGYWPWKAWATAG